MTTVEIKVGRQTRPNRHMAEALTALEQDSIVVLAGINWAIANTIKVAELCKMKKPELHQVAVLETVEENKVRFSVTLTTTEPEEKALGYQTPGVRSRQAEARENMPTRRGRGRGNRRGQGRFGFRGRSRGRGRANSPFQPRTQRLFKRKTTPDDQPREPNEIYVQGSRGIKGLVSNAHELLNGEEKYPFINLKGSGLAVAKTLRLCNVLRNGIEGLHSAVHFSCDAVEFENTKDPEQTRTRTVSSVDIILSLDIDQVGKDDPGYQAPVETDKIKPLEV